MFLVFMIVILINFIGVNTLKDQMRDMTESMGAMLTWVSGIEEESSAVTIDDKVLQEMGGVDRVVQRMLAGQYSQLVEEYKILHTEGRYIFPDRFDTQGEALREGE